MQALFTIAILSMYHSIVFLHGVKGQIELTWTNTLTWFFSKKKKKKKMPQSFLEVDILVLLFVLKVGHAFS